MSRSLLSAAAVLVAACSIEPSVDVGMAFGEAPPQDHARGQTPPVATPAAPVVVDLLDSGRDWRAAPLGGGFVAVGAEVLSTNRGVGVAMAYDRHGNVLWGRRFEKPTHTIVPGAVVPLADGFAVASLITECGGHEGCSGSAVLVTWHGGDGVELTRAEASLPVSVKRILAAAPAEDAIVVAATHFQASAVVAVTSDGGAWEYSGPAIRAATATSDGLAAYGCCPAGQLVANRDSIHSNAVADLGDVVGMAETGGGHAWLMGFESLTLKAPNGPARSLGTGRYGGIVARDAGLLVTAVAGHDRDRVRVVFTDAAGGTLREETFDTLPYQDNGPPIVLADGSGVAITDRQAFLVPPPGPDAVADAPVTPAEPADLPPPPEAPSPCIDLFENFDAPAGWSLDGAQIDFEAGRLILAPDADQPTAVATLPSSQDIPVGPLLYLPLPGAAIPEGGRFELGVGAMVSVALHRTDGVLQARIREHEVLSDPIALPDGADTYVLDFYKGPGGWTLGVELFPKGRFDDPPDLILPASGPASLLGGLTLTAAGAGTRIEIEQVVGGLCTNADGLVTCDMKTEGACPQPNDPCAAGFCNPLEGCRVAPLDCDDQDECTLDWCAELGCDHAPLSECETEGDR